MHIPGHNQLNTVIELARDGREKKKTPKSISLEYSQQCIATIKNESKKSIKNATLTLDQGKATHLGGLQFLLKQYFRCGDR